MAKSERTRKPGHDHLIPEAAWRMYPERHISNRDWENLETYAGHEDWSGDRWAWEFLRHNRFFQQDCDLIGTALQKKSRPRPKLDTKWMLQDFKWYDEPFSKKEDGADRPRWSIFSRVDCWDTNVPLRLKTQQPWPLDDLVLQPGQIALVLDLNGAAAIPEILRLQWSSAWYKMAVSAARLRQAEQKNAAKASAGTSVVSSKRLALPHKEKRIDYLRIADAFSARFPASLEEVCKVLHAEGRLRKKDPETKKNAEFSLTLAKNSLYKMIDASRRTIYEQGYLLLLAEEAAKADWKAITAPFWPHSSNPISAKDVKAWGERASEPPNPFSALLKIR